MLWRQASRLLLCCVGLALCLGISRLAARPSGSPAVRQTPTIVQPEIKHPATLSPQTRQPHFTHVFSSFSAPSGSDGDKEMRLVQRSWQVAAARARELGIEVEFLDVVLDRDIDSVPLFAKRARLASHIVDPFGRSLPTVGEVFRRGAEEGHGRWLLFTNSDIGVVPDFYSKMFQVAKADWAAPAQQRKVLASTFAYLSHCLARRGSTQARLCRADSEVYFSNEGGVYPDLWPAVQRDLARLYVGLRVAAGDFDTDAIPPFEVVGAWYRLAGGSATAASHAVADLRGKTAAKLEGFSPTPHAVPDIAARRSFAFTVTRLDVPTDSIDLGEPLQPVSVDDSAPLVTPALEALYAAAASGAGRTHPGNDCFVVPREHLLSSLVSKLGHPIGWRPWGFWVPQALLWEGLAWRRFTSSGFAGGCTFHVGLSGMVADNWIKIANAHPHFMVFQGANWWALSDGRFGEVYSPPSYCRKAGLWRDAGFCGADGTPPSYCQGNVRLGCSRYQSRALRDVSFYTRQCKLAGGAGASMVLETPICGFCSFLLKREVTCAPGVPIECSNMECPYLQ